MMGDVKVVGPAAREGTTVSRMVSDGEVAWIESWHGLEKGWVKGGMDLTGFLQAAPCSTWWLAAFEIPIEGTRLGDNVSRTLA